jgi:hypothetical protein
MRRCLAWGSLLKAAIESYPANLRVAVLATGGLSHFIGEPGMGQIDIPSTAPASSCSSIRFRVWSGHRAKVQQTDACVRYRSRQSAKNS